MRYLAGEAGGRIAGENRAGNAPYDRIGVEVEDREGFGLVEESRDEAELGLCATVCLSLCELEAGCQLRRRTWDLSNVA